MKLGVYLQPFLRQWAPAYWGHKLDLTGSHEIIDHVTIRLAMCHFLLVPHWNRVSIFNRFPDIRRQNPCAHAHTRRERHAASDFIFCPMQCIALDRQKTLNTNFSAFNREIFVNRLIEQNVD